MPRTAIPQNEWTVPSLREPRYSQSLERGLAILACFTPDRPVLGIADIADSLGMSRSTTHRYVITLVALGYLEQGASRKYRLGLHVTDLGMSALNSTSLREHAQPYLDELRRRTGYTINVAVLDGPEIVYVARARSHRRGQQRIDLGLALGSRLPAYCTAMGKLLLAHLPDSERRELLGEIKLERRTPHDDHQPAPAGDRVRAHPRRRPRRQRPGAHPRAALDRRPDPLRLTRGRRRRQHGRALLDDLAAGPDRPPRPAPRRHRRPHLRAPRLPPR